MIRIVVNGAGKLGQAIISAAIEEATQNPDSENPVEVVAAVDRYLLDARGPGCLHVPLYGDLDDVSQEFDVVVDSSRADGVQAILDFAATRRKPLIIAATGHSEQQLAAVQEAAQVIPILRSSNLSIGVNVVRHLAAEAAHMLGPVDTEIVETHHRMKVDAPSGTALTLAETVRDAVDPSRPLIYGRGPDNPGARNNEIGVHAVRGGTVVGEHTVTFLLEDEIVEIRHVAQSRQVFGFGALTVARFIVRQPAGLYSMEDLLG